MSTKTFNLKNLSLNVAEVFDLTQQQAAAIAQFVFERIREELSLGKQVRLHKFGTLTAKVRAAGVARNPMNGARVVVPSRRVIRLSPAPSLKRQVNSVVFST